MDIIFLIMALVGAVLAFGTTLLRWFLQGVSCINFVSVQDLVTFGIMLLIVIANLGLWTYTTRRSKRVAGARCASVASTVIIGIAYMVLLMSLWADNWFASYMDWCVQRKTLLTVLCIGGWLMMVAAMGWFGHKLYVAITSKGVHASNHVESTPEEPVNDGGEVIPGEAERKGPPSWLFEVGGGDVSGIRSEAEGISDEDCDALISDILAQNNAKNAPQVEGESGN